MRSPIGGGALAAGVVVAILLSAALWPSAQSNPPAEHGFTLADGFEIERIAGPPLVDRPIVADFDEGGRLYVADSSGSNDKVDAQLASRPHRIVRLEDTDGDGRFDKSVVFADRMMFPEGTMWFDGSLYVAAPPSIWKLTDTNGDGVADEREEWFQGKTLTGCANDLHGPYMGLDGWIYWTKGAFAQQTYERPGKAPMVTRASHIFRRRPGSVDIEPVMTGGMDNPVDVAFTPEGERLFTATFLHHPQLGKRDAIVHAIYGGVYGKPHAVIDGHKRTGDLLPVLADLGPAVPSGFTRYASHVFGADYRDNFFATMFNLQKVTRNVLEPNGATFTMRSSDFLVSNNRDFHPTDVLEDADGSLIVIDTGPWYKLCCPTAQLAKPDVPGAIYRVRRKGAPRISDPRGMRLQWASMNPDQAARLLDDARPTVRDRAIRFFGKAQAAGVASLERIVKTSASAEARRNAVWALTRIDGDRAREAVRAALGDRDTSVRHVAIHATGLWRYGAAQPQILAALERGTPAIQRAAAEALGRLGDAGAVAPLLTASSGRLDRMLEHSVTYALIEIGNKSLTRSEGLQHGSIQTRRAALIALDQMEGGDLSSAEIVSLLESSDTVLKETAWWIIGHRPEWGTAMAGYFQKRLTASDLSAAERADLAQKLGQFGDTAGIQELLSSLADSSGPSGTRLAALNAMAASRARLKVLPAVWIAPLTAALGSADEDVVRQAVAVVRAIPAPKDQAGVVVAALMGVARNVQKPAEVRVDALAAVPEAGGEIDAGLFDLLRASLDPSRSTVTRASAASVVERAKLNRDQLLALAPLLRTAGPLELPRLLRAYDGASDEAVGQALIAALRETKSRSSVRPEALRSIVVKFPASLQHETETLLGSLMVDSTQQAERLERLLATLGEGDIRRGQAVFNSPKAACMSCHAIGYMGGRIGPDLTRIGQVRTERDLLESIVYPSASFVRSYEPFTVRTRSGATHSGALRSDLSEEVVLMTASGEEVRISRPDIADIQPGTVSLMPPGLDEQLTRQELADLLAFLKATRSGAN
jgi:putative membrane-bound dehydrogenase-like protein